MADERVEALRPRRLEPDERRRQIMECALVLFGQRPYAAVSTTELAERAGVTRGLVHHYFGTKRGLYLEVVQRMLTLPRVPDGLRSDGPPRDRVGRTVDWFLDSVATHGETFVAVSAEGVGDDPEIERLVLEADDRAARTVLDLLGIVDLGADPEGHSRERAVLRAYGALVKGAVREWVRDGALTRDEVRLLLVEALVAVVRDVLPALDDRGRT